MKKKTSLILALLLMLSASVVMAATYVPKNHWGASDMRLYLNSGAQKNGEWLVDSVNDSKNTTGYAAQFSNKEFERIVPTTVETAIEEGSYWTRDRFYLPSGNYTKDQILSRGEADISMDAAYDAVAPEDVIPISYWAEYADNSAAWLRSGYENDDLVLMSQRGYGIYPSLVEYPEAFAPLFRVNLKNVAFASCASAEELPRLGGAFAKIVLVLGSDAYGKKSVDSLPDYGMYLKVKAPMTFSVNALEFAHDNLIIDYTDANPDYALVVCAYKDDDLKNGTIAYCAAAPVNDRSGSIGIDVRNWRLSSLDGLTIQVWLEEEGVGSLAMATLPETFVGSGRSIQKTEAGAISRRVFASRNDLSCSWGTLADVNDLVGSNPSNQKIYYGKDSREKPMEFWIAGVKNNIMTLYQAKATQNSVFKASNMQVQNPVDLAKPEVPDPDTSDDPDSDEGGDTEDPQPDGGDGNTQDEPEMKPGEVGMPKTGDTSMLGVWICLLGIAGTAMLILRKRMQN